MMAFLISPVVTRANLWVRECLGLKPWRIGGFIAMVAAIGNAQPFHFPTANQKLLEPGREDEFFVGTIGKPWPSGTFGCVRSEGWKFHEGLDIRCQQRDKRGEPIDPVMATADGVVSYVNRKPGLSNYGNYVILKHVIDGVAVFSLYAHLRSIRSDLAAGLSVKQGEEIGVLGRTTNTREGISRDRAHVHFELNLMLTERFDQWYRKDHPKDRNDHGNWNGRALAGLDPQAVFLAQQQQGQNFRFLTFIQNQTEMFRAYITGNRLPWLDRYPSLLRPNPVANREGTAGFEVAINYAGVPYQITPRAASELPPQGKLRLLSVNGEEYKRHPCRRLIRFQGKRWELTAAGTDLLELLAF